MNRAERLARYGLTEGDYQRVLDDQGGGCAICGAPPKPDRSLAVDHDHRNDINRGLLCGRCNLGLGYFRDRPELLCRAADYLEDWPKDYADGCEQCMSEGLPDWMHSPARVDGDGPSYVVATYRCPVHERTWRCWWARRFTAFRGGGE